MHIYTALVLNLNGSKVREMREWQNVPHRFPDQGQYNSSSSISRSYNKSGKGCRQNKKNIGKVKTFG